MQNLFKTPPQKNSRSSNIDGLTVLLYSLICLIGWVTIYSADYSPETTGFFDIHFTHGKQFVWICLAAFMALIIFNIDSKFFSTLAYVHYGITIILLIIVYIVARDVNGARAWIDLGFFRLQPSEFTKFTVSLALAKFLSELDITLANKKHLVIAIGIIVVPFLLILLQHDMGSALVFISFVFLLHREGLSSWVLVIGFYMLAISVLALVIPAPWLCWGLAVFFTLVIFFFERVKNWILSLFYLLIAGIATYYLNKYFSKFFVGGLLVLALFVGYWLYTQRKTFAAFLVAVFVFSTGYVFSIDYVFNKLEAHQKDRINVMLGKGGNDWNVRQSKIALGSGQFLGKGFLMGTQSKGGFLPAKETDFIFCTIGEEWGFVGATLVLGLFIALIWRIVSLAESQRLKFSRIFGYGVACVFIMHFLINVGMTLGLAPVIGIPLPAVSYGGSSLLSFTAMLFVFLKLDSEKNRY